MGQTLAAESRIGPEVVVKRLSVYSPQQPLPELYGNSIVGIRAILAGKEKWGYNLKGEDVDAINAALTDCIEMSLVTTIINRQGEDLNETLDRPYEELWSPKTAIVVNKHGYAIGTSRFAPHYPRSFTGKDNFYQSRSLFSEGGNLWIFEDERLVEFNQSKAALKLNSVLEEKDPIGAVCWERLFGFQTFLQEGNRMINPDSRSTLLTMHILANEIRHLALITGIKNCQGCYILVSKTTKKFLQDLFLQGEFEEILAIQTLLFKEGGIPEKDIVSICRMDLVAMERVAGNVLAVARGDLDHTILETEAQNTHAKIIRALIPHLGVPEY